MNKKEYAVIWGCSSDTGIFKAKSLKEARGILLQSMLNSVGLSSLKEAYEDDNFGPEPDPSVFSFDPKVFNSHTQEQSYVDDGDSPSGSANHESIVWKIVRL